MARSAISDADRILASPLETYQRQDESFDAEFFARLVKDESVAGLVVGLPLHAGGEESQSSGRARDYGAWLAGVTGLPVVFSDERYSTKQAESALWQAGMTHKKRKQRRDQLAAQIMLQAYLEGGA